jgi:hypothetical protein
MRRYTSYQACKQTRTQQAGSGEQQLTSTLKQAAKRPHSRCVHGDNEETAGGGRLARTSNSAPPAMT